MAAPVVTETISSRLASLFNFAKDKLATVAGSEVIVTMPSNDEALSSAASAEVAQVVARRELLAKIISSLLGLAASFGLTYLAVKWMTNAMDPTNKDKKKALERAQEMLKRLGVNNVKLTEYEMCIASNLVDPLSMSISWDDIGGLEDVIQEIQETVILPFRRRDLFASSKLLQAPKGVLLYGPPGCGKTMIAKATAKAAGARFINLQVSSLFDKWYGESQKRAEAVFSLAVKLQPSIIFIDEIDSFLRSRSVNDHEATVMLKTQFMSFWDGLITDPKSQVMIVGATNRAQDVDAAILRRMPCTFQIGMPGRQQREDIFRLTLEEEEVDELDYSKLATSAEGFSGSDISECCRVAALKRVRQFVQEARQQYGEDYWNNLSGELRNIVMEDVEFGIDKVRKNKQTMMETRPSVVIDLD